MFCEFAKALRKYSLREAADHPVVLAVVFATPRRPSHTTISKDILWSLEPMTSTSRHTILKCMTEMARSTFDHIAIAVRSITTSRSFIERELLPEPVGGAAAPGFKSFQWRFANGLKLELLEPFQHSETDFLKRFIDKVGPGPHHLTFRVREIHEAAEICRRAGFPILYVRDSEPDWKEAFIHPRNALGTLIQLAEYPDHGDAVLPEGGFALDHVDIEVPDLERGRLLYETVLGGTVVDSSAHELALFWAGSGGIRLIRSQHGAAGGISRLVLSEGSPSSTPIDDSANSNELRRDDLGTEICLQSRSLTPSPRQRPETHECRVVAVIPESLVH